MKTVFLSSTGKDLDEYRERAYRAIEGLDGYHCVRMEDFGARDQEFDAFCRARVAGCDVFVCVVGHYRGSSPGGGEKSYTEREYDAACAEKKPRLIFLAPGDFPLPAHLIEEDEKRKAQTEFRERVSSERVRDSFSTPEDLAARVVQAIHNWAKEPRSESRPEGNGDEPVTFGALPPQPHFAHPYPLQPNFTGRVRERTMLTGWLTKSDQPILALVAFGGMGKSALAWAWLLRDVLGLPLPGATVDSPKDAEACRVPEDGRPEGAFWWSFYERDSTFEGFLDRALTYAAGGEIPQGVEGAYEKMEALVGLLRERRLLLVLDGFERQLRQYASMEAARQPDEEEDVPAHDRTCADGNAATFLRRLAGGPFKSRVLLTSRLFPKELEGDGGEAAANCGREDLRSMDPKDAVAFFRVQHIKGNRGEIQAACSPYGYHPLALRLLARVIAKDKQAPGDIQVASRHPVLPELKGKEQHHILQVAYDALNTRERGLLSRIAAFRSAVDYEAISIFKTSKNEQRFDAALDELTDRGLLPREGVDAPFDLHPVVRRYAYHRLRNKKQVHERLAKYFADIRIPDVKEVKNVEELAPVIELYHHTIGAGRYDDARDLYMNSLDEPLCYRLGAYQASIELLSGFFPDGEGMPPRLSDQSHQVWVLNGLGNSYSLSGNSLRAGPLLERHNSMQEELGAKRGLAAGQRNLGDDQLKLGAFAAAETNLRNSVQLSKANPEGETEAFSHIELAPLLADRGQFGEAERSLGAALGLLSGSGRPQPSCVVWTYRARIALFVGDAEAALEAARRARELADKVAREAYPVERDFVRTEWLIGAALVALASEVLKQRSKHLAGAEPHLAEALTRCRRINLVESEPEILLSWARWHEAKGNVQEALEYADEALTIADRCEYRLQQADIHNFLAALAMEEGDSDAAIEHATTAYERAWCDGPPHAYQPALDEAARLLEELKVEPPEMPEYEG